MIKTQLRVPEEVWAWAQHEASRNGRSTNAEVVQVLRQAMAAQAAEPQREPADVLSGQLSRPPAASQSEGPEL
jgi:hypothetical protein